MIAVGLVGGFGLLFTWQCWRVYVGAGWLYLDALVKTMKEPTPFKALEELNAREKELKRLLFIIGAETVEEAVDLVKNTQAAVHELQEKIEEFDQYLFECELEELKVDPDQVREHSVNLTDKSFGVLKFFPDWQRPVCRGRWEENTLTAASEALGMFVEKYAEQ